MRHPLSHFLGSKIYISSFVAFGIYLFILASTPDYVNASYVVSNLSNNSGHSLNQRILQSNGFTYFAWTDTSNSPNDKGQIFFRIRNGNETSSSFSPTLILSNNTADSNLPDISATGTNVYVTWEDDSFEDPHIFFRGSYNNGRSFGNMLDISNGTTGATLQNVASYKNSVYLVWVGSKIEDPKNFEIFFRKSDDNGKNFGPIMNLSRSPGDSIDPHIVVPRGRNDVYVTYTDCDAIHDDPLCGTYFVKSSDNGLTFGAPDLISIISPFTPNVPFLGHFHPPIISSLLSALGTSVHKHVGEHNSVIPVITSSDDGKDVYILWQDDMTQTGASDIFFRKSNDYGNTFGDSINLSNTPGVSRLPQMITLGTNLYVVWSDTNMAFNQFDVFFTKIDDHGNKIGKTINLSNSKGNSAPSDIGAVKNSDKIYIVWTEATGDKHNIFMTRSADEGRTFDKPIKVDYNNSVNPSLIHISDQNGTGLAWTEYSKQNEDIFFASIDG